MKSSGADAIKEVLYGRWGAPLRIVHRLVVNAMLVGLGVAHRIQFREGPDPRLAEQATIAVKTFERPAAIKRFVRSARRVFAGRIVIADDSRRPLTSSDPLVDVIALPFNSGVSHGRNAALDAVTTPYVLVADDDMVYTRATNWAAALDYLADHPEVDAVAGIQVELPRWYTNIFNDEPLFAGHAEPLRPDGELIDGLPVRLKTPQAYLARTASIQKVRWNEQLRMLDHSDFFSRAAGTLVFVQAMGIPVFHARTPWNATYTRHREDTGADKKMLGKLWSSAARGEG